MCGKYIVEVSIDFWIDRAMNEKLADSVPLDCELRH